MKRFIGIAMALGMLSGCSGMTGVGDGRFDATVTIRGSEEQTKQVLLQTKQVEMQTTAESKAKQNPTIVITTPDNTIITMDFEPMITAAVGGNTVGSGTYGVDVITTPLPQGQIAEMLEAGGNAAAKVGNTPAVVAGSVGYFIKEALQATGGGGNQITAENIDMQESFRDVENHIIGEGNEITANGRGDTMIDQGADY